jgi:hypothetical protein
LSLFAHYARHRFAWLFVSLLLTLAANPVFEAVFRVNPIEVLLAVNLLAAIAGAAQERWVRVLVYLGAVFVAVRVFAAASDASYLLPASSVAWLIAVVIAVVATARYAFRAESVDGEHVCAALDAYLLVGLLFGVGYALLDQVSPASFGAAAESDLTLVRGIYFSFVTLATLGYGDIVPTSDLTRGLAILEAVIGQFYLTVFVARLVSLYSRPRRT